MSNYSSQYTFQAVDQITPFITKIKGQIKALKQQMRGMSQSIKLNVDAKMAQQQIKKLSVQFKGFASKPQVLSVNTSNAQHKIKDLSNYYRNSISPSKIKWTVADTGKVKEQWAEKATTQAVDKEKEKGDEKSEKASDKFDKIMSSAWTLARKTAVDSALEQDNAINKLKKATGENGVGLEILKTQALALASQTGYSDATVMGMMADSANAGVANKNLASDALFSIKTGIAFDMPMEEAKQAMTELKAAFFGADDYAGQQKGLQGLVSMISYVADNTAATEKNLVSFMQSNSDLVNVMGITKESLVAAGATFEAVGIAPTKAEAAMKSMHTKMAELVHDSVGMEALGLNPKNLQIDMQKDLIGTTLQVIKQAQSMDKIDSIVALKDIYKEFGGDLVNFTTIQKLYQDNLVLTGEKEKQAAAFAQAYQVEMEGLNASWNRAKEGLKSVLGVALTPYLKIATDAVAGLMAFMKENPTLIKFAAGLVAIASAAKAYSFATIAIKAFTTQIGKSNLAKSMAVHTAWMWGGRLQALAPAMGALNSPMARAALGASILSGSFVLAYNNSSFFREQLSGLGSQLMEIVSSFGFAGSGAEAFVMIGALIGEVFGGVVLVIRWLIMAIQGAAGAMAAFFNEGDFKSVDGLKTKFTAVKDEVLSSSNDINKMLNEAGKAQEASALKVGDKLAEIRRSKPQAQEMQNISNAVNNTKADAFYATGIPTTATPEALAANKEISAQQQQVAETSKNAADTTKQAADTQKSSADRIGLAANQMLVAASQMIMAATMPLTVNVGGCTANTGDQGR